MKRRPGKFNPWMWFLIFIAIFITAICWFWTSINQYIQAPDKVAGFIGAVIAFAIAFTQYIVGQGWKKTEFVAEQYKIFVNDRYVQRVMHLLDYPISTFQLFDDEVINERSLTKYWVSFPGQKIILECNFSTVAVALSAKYDDEKLEEFDSGINIIRFSFDKFLFKLGIFQKYIEAKLISAEDIWPYLNYWINVIKEPEKKGAQNGLTGFSNMKKELINFIKRYENDYPSLLALLKSFDMSIDALVESHK